MDFDLEWHQEELRSVARGFLASSYPHERLRALEESEIGYTREGQRELAELGWLELGLGAGADGEAVDILDLLLLYEELGRAAVPGPHFISSVLAGSLLQSAGGVSRASLLEQIGAAEQVVSVAIYEESACYDAGGVALAARFEGGEVVLAGRKLFVPYALGAESLLVLARSGGRDEDLSWVLVPADAAGVSITPMAMMSNDKLFAVEFEAVTVAEDALVGARDGGWAALRAVLPRANVVQAAELLGLAGGAFEMAVEYAKVRIAFGRPIGAFQAIQHKCADMLADLDAARYLLYQAACLINDGEPEDPRVAMAKAFGATAARRITKEAHQIYAGHGFVIENRLNYYYRRQKAIELALGDVGEQLGRVADRIGI